MERGASAGKGFEHSYEAFLWKELSIIRELERNGDYYQALDLAVSLLKYLHPEVRKQQQAHAREILEKVRKKVGSTVGVDLFNTQQLRNDIAQEYGMKYLEEILTDLSDQLGKRFYMERGAAARPRHPSKDKMKVPQF